MGHRDKSYIFGTIILKRSLYIRVFAFIMLVAFSANVFAFCRCEHECGEKVKKERAIKSCCQKKQAKKYCRQKECGCEKKIVKFQMLEKRVSQNNVALEVAFMELPRTILYAKSIDENILLNTTTVYKEIFGSASPPNYCILYNQFRI